MEKGEAEGKVRPILAEREGRARHHASAVGARRREPDGLPPGPADVHRHESRILRRPHELLDGRVSTRRSRRDGAAPMKPSMARLCPSSSSRRRSLGAMRSRAATKPNGLAASPGQVWLTPARGRGGEDRCRAGRRAGRRRHDPHEWHGQCSTIMRSGHVFSPGDGARGQDRGAAGPACEEGRSAGDHRVARHRQAP